MTALDFDARFATPLAPPARRPGWRRHGVALALAAAAILLICARDAGDMAALWWGSSTYEHILLIPAIIAWLVWQRRDGLARLTPRAWAPGLALVGCGAFGWLLGDAAGVALARHLGLVVMLQGAVVACLGPKVARGLLFPLAYMLFLVPAGDELVPALQTLTAKMCMTMLGWANVSAHIEGVFITTPDGYFEVAEACSGVKFLVAMIAYGALVANTCFTGWGRRIALMAACAVVPVLANGVRAWGTIYAAHLTDAETAGGFDHIVYGWIFFGVVIVLVVAGAWRFFDRSPDDVFFDPAAIEPVAPAPAPGRRLPIVAAAVVAIALTPIVWGQAIAATGTAALPAQVELPEIAGWRRVEVAPLYPWTAHFDGADRMLHARYRDAGGRLVDLSVAIFAAQAEGRELVGYGQGAVAPESGWAWVEDAPSPAGGRAFRITAPGPVVRAVTSFYRVGDMLTGSETRVKLETLKVRLIGGPQRAVALIVSGEGDEGRPAVDAFVRAMGDPAALADGLAGGR